MTYSNSKWAIIDIGSNTIRLVIYEKNAFGRFKQTGNIKSSARLRHYLDKDGILAMTGAMLLIKVLQGFREILEYHKVEYVQCVATAAIRQAVNKDAILKMVKEKTGFDVRILTGEEEAFYGCFAVMQTTPFDEGVTIDVGGGSTEITHFRSRQLVHLHSFPFGVVSLKEQYITGETITAEETDRLRHFIRESLHTLPWIQNLKVPILAIGGSARSVAQMDQNLKKYPLSGIHQYSMAPTDLKRILSVVDKLTVPELEKLEGVTKERADLILPALEIFSELSDYVQAPEFMFSGKGLRDGIFLKEFEHRDAETDSDKIIRSSMEELVHDYKISYQHSRHVACLARQISSQLESKFGIKMDSQTKRMMELSARVYYLGQYVDPAASSQHTFYLLANSSINGLEHKERLQLAFIASFKNYALLKQYYAPFQGWFTKEKLQEIRVAGAIVKLASALDVSKRGIVKQVALQKTGEQEGILTLTCNGNCFAERGQAEKQKRHLEKALKLSLTLLFEES